MLQISLIWSSKWSMSQKNSNLIVNLQPQGTSAVWIDLFVDSFLIINRHINKFIPIKTDHFSKLGKWLQIYSAMFCTKYLC